MSEYRINGNHILDPSTGQWLNRRAIDVQGDGRPIYAPVRAFELKWELTNYQDWADLQHFFRLIDASGTVTAHLPGFPLVSGSAFAFQEYSGCVMGEPTIGPFFAQQYPTDVSVLILNIVPE